MCWRRWRLFLSLLLLWRIAGRIHRFNTLFKELQVSLRECDAKQRAKRSKLRPSSIQHKSVGLTIVFVSKLLKFSASGLVDGRAEELQPAHVGSSCDCNSHSMSCMPLCRCAIDGSLRCLQSQLHAFLPLSWPYQLLETEIKISQVLLDTWSTRENCESSCGALCSINALNWSTFFNLSFLAFSASSGVTSAGASWECSGYEKWKVLSRSALGVLFFAILRHAKELQWRDLGSSRKM